MRLVPNAVAHSLLRAATLCGEPLLVPGSMRGRLQRLVPTQLSLTHLIRSTPLPGPIYAAASLTSSATLFRWAPPSSLSSPAVCRHWERQGLADGQACKMGSKCTFAHGPSQLGKPLGQDRELAKASECKSFQDQKWCQLGKACRYTHNGRWPEDSDKYPTDYRGAPKASSPESLTRDPQRDAMSALPGGKSDPTADPHDPPSSLLGQPAIIKRGHNFRPAKVRRRRQEDEEGDLRALTLCCLFSVMYVYSSTH